MKLFDPGQVIVNVYDEVNNALRINSVVPGSTFFVYDQSPIVISSTDFYVINSTAPYAVGDRVQGNGTPTGTIYGTISAVTKYYNYEDNSFYYGNDHTFVTYDNSTTWFVPGSMAFIQGETTGSVFGTVVSATPFNSDLFTEVVCSGMSGPILAEYLTVWSSTSKTGLETLTNVTVVWDTGGLE